MSIDGHPTRAQRTRLANALAATFLLASSVSLWQSPASAATVTENVSCSGSWSVYDITAAQGDTVDVVIDSSCYNDDDNSAYSYSPPSSNPDSYFSSYPGLGDIIESPEDTFTFVIKSDAPVGTMPGTTFSNLPFVCSNCATGAVLRFTITASESSSSSSSSSTSSSSTVPSDGSDGTDSGSGGGGSGDLGDTGLGAAPLVWTALGLLGAGLVMVRRARPATD